VPEGGSFNYMTGIRATDAEDGVITSRVIHNTPVNTNNVGAYKVTYTVTDSDGNTVRRNGVVLVGSGWIVRGGYALYAQDFARRLSAISGTNSEAIRLAKAMAVWIADTTSDNFGQYVTVSVADDDGYRRAVGNYRIVFTVSENRTVTKTIRASISDDRPVTPPATPAPNVVVNTPPPAAPVVTPAPDPVIVEVPVPTAPPVETPETTEPPVTIEPEEPPLAPVEEGSWHLIDLLLVIFSMALGFYLMVYSIRRRDEYDEQSSARGRQIRMWGHLGVILGVFSLVALLVTQDFTGRMMMADPWAALFAVILAVEVLALVGLTRVKGQEWEEEREI
jgi:hypothetical protein